MLVPDASPEVEDVSAAPLSELLPLESELDVDDDDDDAGSAIVGPTPKLDSAGAPRLHAHPDTKITAREQVAARTVTAARAYRATRAVATCCARGGRDHGRHVTGSQFASARGVDLGYPRRVGATLDTWTSPTRLCTPSRR